MHKKSIAFVWGGSGGHIQPIASLFDYAKQYTNIPSQINRYRFGQSGWLEQTYADRYESVLFVPVLTGKLRRYRNLTSTLENIRDVFLIVAWFFQSLRKLKQYKIDVIFCKGGFVCPAVAYAGWVLHIPVLVHESDTHSGLANRMTYPVATTVFTGFGWVVSGERVVWQILSPQLLDFHPMDLLWLDLAKTVVLVMWGSQWARILFDTILDYVESCAANTVQFIFLLGTKNQWAKDYSREWHVWTLGYLDQPQLWYVMDICDASITRGAATSLQEQHNFWLQKAIVPLPHTWWDHQTVNAKYYQEQYGDVWIPQDDALVTRITWFVDSLSDYKKEKKTPSIETLCRASVEIWEELMSI